ncbi:MAG: IS200/IS605 family transposase [Marinoscillum sp.]|uniref:IS200/IS605 family transposase n=1 Tax=Marinoscillum sp. TaxID=2024838 RepID=UPI0033053133
MANTYTQLYVHVDFAVRGRQNMISPKWKEELYKYITGIVTNKGQKLMIINGMPDHLHMLIGMKPDLALSDLIRDIKANSSKFINEKGLATGKFGWQNGFGAFTVGQSQKENVINYIKHQEEHHSHKTFREEYIGFLKAYEVAYSDEYIFE